MNWDDLRAFIVLADHETFTYGAKELGISVATLTRKIDRLEADLSLSLFRRSPSGVKLTPEGKSILGIAQQSGAYLGELERVAAAISSGEMRDPVRISSTEPVIADILAPHVAVFYRDHPEIQLELTVSPSISNLQRRETDLAIRLARPKEPSLMARKLIDVDLGVYAARALAESYSADQSWRDYPFVSFDNSYGDIPELVWIKAKGVGASVCFRSSSTRAQLQAVKSGLGTAILPAYMALQEPDLIRLDTPPIAKRPLWLVFHRDMKDQPAIKRVRAWIQQTCKSWLKHNRQI